MKAIPTAIALACAVSFAPIALAQEELGTSDPSFMQLDTDLDGKLSQQEADKSPMLKGQHSQADVNQDGGIDASEFSAFVATSGQDGQMGGSSGAGQVSFSDLDVDKDGMLNQSEAQSHPTLSQQYSTVDQDQDGSISQAEFSAFEAKQGGQTGAAGGQQLPPFDQLDINKDGFLSGTEVQGPQISKQYSALDTNKDRWISKQEYDAKSGAAAQGQTGQVSFQSLDLNRDGSISQDEANSSPSIKNQFTQIDKDGNGMISQSEFSAFERAQKSGGAMQ